MDLLVNRVIDGLGNGAIYASLALAIVLVFRSTGTINLAQGEMGMFCAFIAWKVSSPTGLGWPIIVAIVMAMGAGLIGGALIERVVIRPVERHESHLQMIIVTLGLFLGIDALAGKLFTLNSVTLASPFPTGGLRSGGIELPYQTIGLLGILIVVAALMWFLFARTRLGLAMRASVDNPESARLVGIRRGRMLAIGWGLAGAIGALSACLVAPATLVDVTMLQGVLLYSFAAATLGGFDSPVGAIVGGIVIGLLQVLVSGYVTFIGNQLSLLTALAVIMVMLLVKPTGLFGRTGTERV
jgi:branched-chain amino acid transport system permease protein